jgi:hypothetical protein
MRVGGTLVLLALAGCDASTGVGNSILRVRADGERLTLSTDGDEAVFFFAIDAASAPLADWIPCTRPEQSCRRVSKGADVEIPYGLLIPDRARAGREALVYFWRLNPAPAYGIRGTIDVLSVRYHAPVVGMRP